jgi:hypothetical protein
MSAPDLLRDVFEDDEELETGRREYISISREDTKWTSSERDG